MILPNARLSAHNLLALHNGRGAQKAILAHNLNRELQISTEEPARSTTQQRAPWWPFVRLGTPRMSRLQRAGRLTKSNGRLALTLSENPDVQTSLLHYLKVAV